MIDTTLEEPIPLTVAARGLPRRRGDAATHVSSLYRWSTVGCRGVVLETIQVGATRCTSREALQRFYDRLTEARPTGPVWRARPVAAPPCGRRS